MKIKNRRWHKKRYLETNILNSVSKGKILKQVDIKVPEKYLNDSTFDIYDMEKDYNIKVCKLFTKVNESSKYYITILNKNEYEKQLQNLSKPFRIEMKKSLLPCTFNFLNGHFVNQLNR